MLPEAAKRAETFWQEVAGRYEQLRHDVERPILPPDELYLHTNETLERLKNYPQVRINHADGEDHGQIFACLPPPTLPVEARAANPLKALESFLLDFNGRVLLTAETTGRRENLLELLKTGALNPHVYNSWADFLDGDAELGITVAPIEQGLLLEEPEIAVISEPQLFGERVAQRRRRATSERDTDAIVRNLTELHIGAPVVHEMHGVGRYMGLTTLTFDDRPAEFLTLEYSGGDKLYVPVSALDVISRYTGVDPDAAPLHKLGTDQWEKAKKKAAARARDVAAELLELHARRAAREGHVFEIDALDYQSFVQGFPFEETPDQ
ncbi:MAG: CarD family transcriptional regulator, partial [Pseudomonadota bacterium]